MQGFAHRHLFPGLCPVAANRRAQALRVLVAQIHPPPADQNSRWCFPETTRTDVHQLRGAPPLPAILPGTVFRIPPNLQNPAGPVLFHTPPAPPAKSQSGNKRCGRVSPMPPESYAFSFRYRCQVPPRASSAACATRFPQRGVAAVAYLPASAHIPEAGRLPQTAPSEPRHTNTCSASPVVRLWSVRREFLPRIPATPLAE